jgi:hypothetical protein
VVLRRKDKKNQCSNSVRATVTYSN